MVMTKYFDGSELGSELYFEIGEGLKVVDTAEMFLIEKPRILSLKICFDVVQKYCEIELKC